MEVLMLLFLSVLVLLALSFALILICLRNRKQHAFSFDELERYRCELSSGQTAYCNPEDYPFNCFSNSTSSYMEDKPFQLSASKHKQSPARSKDYISSAHSGLKELKGLNKRFAIENYFILFSLFEKSRKLYRAARKRSKTSFMPTKLTVIYEELSE